MSVEFVWPAGSMSLLTQLEADLISHTSQGELYNLYRNCSLAVLNSGNKTDNSKELLENYENFEINVIRTERGLKIELINPPKSAFVDGKIVFSLRNHLYSVLRDIVQINPYADQFRKIIQKDKASRSELITNGIFTILRNAGTLQVGVAPNIAVCWGGHSISEEEYEYAYQVGFAMGLRKIDICTGCGPGIMEAPMKGSIMGHTMQSATEQCRLIGLTEPSIIAAEPPNSMVSELVIMPDIEKRLEAFVRLGHVLVVFPGGPGTAEELLYILTIKMCKENRHIPTPLILTGNKDSAPYFNTLEAFLKKCFGPEVTRYYKLIIDDPDAVAREVKTELQNTYEHRSLTHDSFCYNWALHIPESLQIPFEVTHENMSKLNLHKDQEPYELSAALRAAFSGIVSGNVKEKGVRLVAEKGPFKLHGDKEIIQSMDQLLKDFIDQGRILLSKREYKPCYVLEDD
ncbi:MAG: LOG family protein [Succinivibrio sp.]|nr:LOG family protein [Succinivibrio sp.]